MNKNALANINLMIATLKASNGKATVIGVGGRVYLRSYATIVARVENGKVSRYWAGQSATTTRHLRAFFDQFGGDMAAYKAASVEALPVEVANIAA